MSAPNAQKQAAKIAASNAAAIDRLTSALEAGDVAAAERAAAHVRGPLLVQLQFTQALAEQTPDQKQKEAISASAGKASALTPQLLSSAYLHRCMQKKAVTPDFLLFFIVIFYDIF